MRARILCLAAALLLLLSACGHPAAAPAGIRTADMLTITNETADFAGCRARFDAVCSAMEAKVNVLEEAHNRKIQTNEGDQYFLNENYILSAFSPFALKLRTVVAGFSAEMTPEAAKEQYRAAAGGKEIEYQTNEKATTLRFVSEAQEEVYTAEYDKAGDALRCTYVVDNGDTETLEEFLEFVPLGNHTYAMQSRTTRAVIQFDSEGVMRTFTCAQTAVPLYGEADSIFPAVKALPEGWAPETPQANLLQIHTFADEILTHADRSSGPWKTVKINAATYASAFYV